VAIIRSLSFDTLKSIDWQRPDDGHYRPKHVVFWPTI